MLIEFLLFWGTFWKAEVLGPILLRRGCGELSVEYYHRSSLELSPGNLSIKLYYSIAAGIETVHSVILHTSARFDPVFKPALNTISNTLPFPSTKSAKPSVFRKLRLWKLHPLLCDLSGWGRITVLISSNICSWVTCRQISANWLPYLRSVCQTYPKFSTLNTSYKYLSSLNLPF